jgi:hypothetical protein
MSTPLTNAELDAAATFQETALTTQGPAYEQTPKNVYTTCKPKALH